jgi:hypothetical protein
MVLDRSRDTLGLDAMVTKAMIALRSSKNPELEEMQDKFSRYSFSCMNV